MTADNAEQQGRLPALEKLVAQQIGDAELIIGLRRTQGLEAAADAMRNGPGQQIGNDFQAGVRQLQDEELRLLGLRNDDAKQRLPQAKSVMVLGTVLGLLIAAAAGWSIQQRNSDAGRPKRRFGTAKSNIGCCSTESRTTPFSCWIR